MRMPEASIFLLSRSKSKAWRALNRVDLSKGPVAGSARACLTQGDFFSAVQSGSTAESTSLWRPAKEKDLMARESGIWMGLPSEPMSRA